MYLLDSSREIQGPESRGHSAKRTKPSGTVTLARPTRSKVSRSTQVSGSQRASEFAGQTIPPHEPLNITASAFTGARDSAASSSDVRNDLYDVRAAVAASSVKTFSDYGCAG